MDELANKIEAKAKQKHVQILINTEQFKKDHGLIEQLEGWYRFTSKQGYLMYRTDNFMYGFDIFGEWISRSDRNGLVGIENYTIATHQEVKDALVKHWEKDNEAFDDYAWHEDDRQGHKGKLFGWNNNTSINVIELFNNGVWKDIEPTKEQKIEILWKERKQDK